VNSSPCQGSVRSSGQQIDLEDNDMKEGIHPKYMLTKVTCACGNEFETKSTLPNMSIEICNACHPFYTGTQKLVDTTGRVERFKKKYGLSDN